MKKHYECVVNCMIGGLIVEVSVLAFICVYIWCFLKTLSPFAKFFAKEVALMPECMTKQLECLG